ncbi:adenylate kinase [Buchnera aphidicola (Muscaphis stroyani)]|uniref:Adenylate kinase n=1 Tax=Buchnera aphidicola (Muscaphis stroyani) TaxID=1241869 RepID=A0A4D6YFR4_9GAMM|nr:adenylate kinase [Buchnera aphidicola]QCI24520.1 adenylate kinase [Buchnera aphidicola (Muscaphis stroyani)]
MRIVLLGAPGTGKGTQGKFIVEKYKIPSISTGDILRENIYLKNEIGNKIKKKIQKGQLVSNKIVCNVIKQRIEKNDCINGFMLDGFPRTIDQAHFLSKLNIKIDYVIEFIVPYELILERISGRRIHVPSGRVYHIKFNPPQIEEKDDVTGDLLSLRKDDNLEILKKRLEEHKKNKNLLDQYYKNEKKIGNIKYFKINGTDSVLNIKNKIQFILQ